MNDSNWKKITRIGMFICSILLLLSFTVKRKVPAIIRKYRNVLKGVQESQDDYVALCETAIVKRHRSEWEMMERTAQLAQQQDMSDIAKMDIYDVAEDKGTVLNFARAVTHIRFSSVPR